MKEKFKFFLLKKLVNINYYHLKTSIRTGILILMTGIPLSAWSQTMSLAQCIDSAMLHNDNLKIAEQEIRLASEKKKEITGTFLPKLNASADYRYFTDLPYQLMPASVFGGPAGTYKEVQFGVPQNLSANLQLNVPLFNPASVGAMKISRKAEDIAALQQIKTEEQVILEVSQAYYNAQILLNQLIFFDSNIVNTSKLELTTALLFQQKVIKGTDHQRVQLQLEQLKAIRTTVYTQYRQVMNLVEFLMGKEPSGSIEADPSVELLSESDFQILETTDMKLAAKKKELTEAELAGLRLSLLPSLNAYGIYGTSGLGNTGSGSFFNLYPVGFAGIQLNIPLFSGTITKHKISQKKIDVQKTGIQEEIVRDKTKMEISNAEKQYMASREYSVTTLTQIELAKKIYYATILQNIQGTAGISDVLTADYSLREAQQNYTSGLITLFKAELELRRVTGNLINKH